jgi:hypothetical protein
MKAYNLKAKKYTFPFGVLELITLGEKGPWRAYTIVSCPTDIKDGDNVNWETTFNGNMKIIKGDDGFSGSMDNGWLARISTEWESRRYIGGRAYNTSKTKEISVLEVAQGAYGADGRKGYWRDYIMHVPVGACICLEPSEQFIYFGEKKVLRMTTDEMNTFTASHEDVVLDTTWEFL